MKISQNHAVALFNALGFKMSHKWPVEKLEKKLTTVNDNTDEETDVGSDELNEILRSVQKANEKKTKVIVFPLSRGIDEAKVEDPAPNKKKKAAPAKKEEPKKAATKKKVAAKKEPTKKKAVAKKEPTKKKAKKEDDDSVEQDRFGSRVDSQRAIINKAFVGKKSHTLDELVTTTGLAKSRIRRHIKRVLIAKLGVVEETKTGYKVK